ncbi:hypothetical protein [Streptomyces sp. NBC_00258]|uniref:hypothetical protein n=1 Tax=Streptomyces sp. NBC_00258 TaxID=2903642 RepID=UPI002E2A67AB|nr:hypothetical protein [Streptomyces sp. NBC_00258]
MSVRSRAVRDRQSRIGRIARHLNREHGCVRPDDVVSLAVGCGIKVTRPEVVHVLVRLRLRRR